MSLNKVNYVVKGSHKFIENSKIDIVRNYSIYSHRESLRIIIYKGSMLKENLNFKTVQLFEAYFKKIILEAQQDIPPFNHSLFIGSVLVRHTNPNSLLSNKVYYYQVIDILDSAHIMFQRIDSDVIRDKTGNSLKSIPLPNLFIDTKEVQIVIQNSIKFSDGSIATKLDFTNYSIEGVCNLHIYKPQEFGLNI